MVSFVLPGHNYMGPGNDLNSGIPVDSDDEIARKHDKAYQQAECKSDVYRADEIAIFSFMVDWIRGFNWHSALGAVGSRTTVNRSARAVYNMKSNRH